MGFRQYNSRPGVKVAKHIMNVTCERNAMEMIGRIDSPKAFFYFPMWDIRGHLNMLKFKDVGEMPFYLANMGYRVTFATGKGSINEEYIFKSIETGNIDRFSILENLKEIMHVVFLLKEIYYSKLILILTSPPSALALAFIVRFMNLLSPGYKKRKIILRMDTDGELFETPAKSFYYVFLLSVGSIIFHSIVVESTCAKEKLSKYCLKKSISIVPEGYSKRIYRPHPHYSPNRRDVILFTGRIVPIKGIDVLIRAFQLIHTSYPKWRLRIAGPIEDKDYYKKLELLTHELNLNSSVDFLGELSNDELSEEYLTASIFASLSRTESFSIARIEAIINGLPVVTTGAGCGRDLAGAIIVPYDDPVSSANAIKYLINDPKRRADLVEEGQRTVLSWEEVTEEILYGGKK